MGHILSHLYNLQRSAGDLIKSETASGTDMVQGGIGEDSMLLLIQRKDISAIDLSALTEDIIESITLLASKSGYIFQGYRQSLKPKYRAVRGPAGNTMYIHELDYFVFSYSQATKNNLTRKGHGRYVAIYVNSKQDENAFEVMGSDVGVELLELERAPGENGGSIRIKLTTPEAEPEAKMPKTFYDGTSYATTLALVLGLANLPTITSLSVLAAAAAGGTAITVTGTNFYGGGSNNAVVSLTWVNQQTAAEVAQAAYTVVSDTSITLSTPAMAAGLYRLKIVTLQGVVTGTENLVVS